MFKAKVVILTNPKKLAVFGVIVKFMASSSKMR